jgi:probable HAF family extracellular repeat protein
VSDDGNVVVGIGSVSRGFEAFRWSATGGMVGLGSLDLNDFGSAASAVSANGNVIVGVGSGAADLNGEAFVWFPGTGMSNLKQYLLNNGVSGVQGWRLIAGTGVSADGRTIVGTALDPLGKPAAWIAQIQIDTSASPPPSGDSTETVAPTAISILSGTHVSGGVVQLQNSDDTYLRVRSTGKRVMQVAITGRASRSQVSQLRFSVEAAATGSVTRQDVALFDFAAGTWVTLRQGTATTTDATVVITATQPARFIEPGTLRVRARVTFVPSGGMKVTTNARIDRATWTRVP